MSSISTWHMPAEWYAHKGCWMLWPYRKDNWRGDAVPARIAFSNVAKAIGKFETVTIGAREEDSLDAQSYFESGDNVSVIVIDSNDSWMRDSGPTFLIRKDSDGIAGMNWQFNAWGNIIECDRDVLIAHKVMDAAGVSDRFDADFILEGGSIHVDGEGTVLTTEECLLHPNRNPSLSKQDIEDRLLRHLGAQKVIWLKRGLHGDEDTNGHIDNICCFSSPGEVILTWCDDPSDPQYEISRECFDTLSQSIDARGRSLVIHKLMIPTPMHYTREDIAGLESTGGSKEAAEEDDLSRGVGQRLAASYVNFYIANGGIVCPSYHPETDELAVSVLQTAFPRHQIVQVPGRDILLGGGNIHCITQQQPVDHQ